MATISQRVARWRPLFRRIILEVSLPILCAIVWGIIAWTQGRTLFESLSLGSVAFLFVFFLQGQVLRMSKNVRDEERGEEFIYQLQSLRQSVNELHALGLAPHAPPPSPSSVEPPPGYIEPTRPIPLGFTFFLQQAHQALESGQYYAAALVAAVGFEFAARRSAEQLGLETDRRGLGVIIRHLASRTENSQVMERLAALNRTRNSLVHAEQEAPWINRDEALDLINAFNVGVHYLDQAV